MTISIFSMRWHGIKGETIERGSKYQMNVIRVQTTKDGAWQSLNDGELLRLISEHNQNLNAPAIDLKKQIKKLGSDSLLPKFKKKAKAKK